jgi:hypothetical protein
MVRSVTPAFFASSRCSNFDASRSLRTAPRMGTQVIEIRRKSYQ